MMYINGYKYGSVIVRIIVLRNSEIGLCSADFAQYWNQHLVTGKYKPMEPMMNTNGI